MRCPHTTFAVGKRVLVFLRDGTSFIDKYAARHRKTVKFAERGNVLITDIRSISIYKQR